MNAQAEIDGNPRSKIAQYRRPTAPGELPAIVLHELVTNASKYGAFSTPDGRITVRWDLCEDQARLALEWIEAGGPPVVPGQPSFGTGVIRNLIPYELGGTVDLAFQAEGLRCTITLPTNCLA